MPNAEETNVDDSAATPGHPDWVTCCVCQSDMSEAIAEQEDRDDWPDWLNAGCCCQECSLSADHKFNPPDGRDNARNGRQPPV